MLELKNITKKFPDFQIQKINLKVSRGEYYIILGKSGSGKTILLETIAGLVNPDEGAVWLNNKDITRKRIQNRQVGLVFQDYAIFPHKTVFQNIAYPLKLSGESLKKKVTALAEKTGVSHLLHRYPDTLSGGEVQRTVLARTLALEPEVLLLDEPLTSLDVQYKKELQGLLRSLNAEGQTVVHVTHDYEEALALANRIAVMHDGVIVQEGPVQKVFRNPKNKFIADFVGIRNFFVANLQKAKEQNLTHALINEQIGFVTSEQLYEEGKAIVTVDAKSIVIAAHRLDSTALNNFRGVITDVIPVINGLEVIVDIGVELAAIITRNSYKHLDLQKGKMVWVSFKASSVRVQPY